MEQTSELAFQLNYGITDADVDTDSVAKPYLQRVLYLSAYEYVQ